MSTRGSFIGDSLGGFIGDTLTKWYSLFSNGVKSFKVAMVNELPVKGFVNLNNDYAKVSLTLQPYNYSDGFSELIKIDIRDEYVDYENIIGFYEGTGGLDNKMYLLGIRSTKRLQLTIFNDGSSGADIALVGDSLDIIKYVKMECSFGDARNAKTVTVTSYDEDFIQLRTASATKDLTQDFKPKTFHMGSRVYEDHRAAINVYSHDSFHMGLFDYVIRLWTESHADKNKIISDTSIEAVLQDDSPLGAVYPYKETNDYFVVADYDGNGDII